MVTKRKRENEQDISIIEDAVRNKLKELGFQKIRKKYGQRHTPIISADISSGNENMRIWVELTHNYYQAHHIPSGNRTSGTIEDLLRQNTFMFK